VAARSSELAQHFSNASCFLNLLRDYEGKNDAFLTSLVVSYTCRLLKKIDFHS